VYEASFDHVEATVQTVTPTNPRLQHLIGAALLIASVAAVVAFGLLGVGRSGRFLADFDYYYAAGKSWLAGPGMYDAQAFARAMRGIPGANVLDPDYIGFGYPPHFAVISVAFGLLDVSTARVACALISCVAIACIAWATAQMVRNPHCRRPASAWPISGWLVAAIVVGWPFTAHALWLGQASLWVCAALLLGWHFQARHREILGGVLLGVATIKPPLLVLVFLFLVLTRRWRVLLAATTTALLLASYACGRLGPLSAVRQWVHTLGGYDKADFNALGHHHVVGLPSLLVAAHLPGPNQWVSLAGAAILVVALCALRERFEQDDWLSILLLIPMALVYVHDGELIFLAPVVASLWLHLGHRPRAWLPALVMLAGLCFPGRLVRELGVPVLNQWRTVILLGGLGTIVSLSLSSRKRGLPPRQVAPQTAGAA
jgi:hypothetical protein